MNIIIENPRGVTLLTNGTYCSENINLAIDGGENVLPKNIVEGVTILGMTGTAITITPEQLEELSNL